MLEPLKYALECAWYMFLFIPLVCAMVVVICLAIAAIYALFCNCVVPATENMRTTLWKSKRERERKE